VDVQRPSVGRCIDAARIAGHHNKPASRYLFAACLRGSQPLVGGGPGAANPNRGHSEQIGVSLAEKGGRSLPQICKERRIITEAKKKCIDTARLKILSHGIDVILLFASEPIVESLSCVGSVLAKLASNPTRTATVTHDSEREVECIQIRFSMQVSSPACTDALMELLFYSVPQGSGIFVRSANRPSTGSRDSPARLAHSVVRSEAALS
jgi:hypothetical protein